MTLAERIDVLVAMGDYIRHYPESLQAAVQQAYFHNGWFTEENSRTALHAIATQWLLRDALTNFALANQVQEPARPLTIAIIMAGNIPLVGFHDWLCVFLAGHKSLVKLSDKDAILLPFLLGQMVMQFPALAAYTQFAEGRMTNFDGIIATGSNNSARYFEHYFANYPHIIRKNRNSVAILTGAEDATALRHLATDIFQYFGLGCRNVSKIYVPKGYDFQPLLEILHEHNQLVLHDKYKNNFDYQFTLAILNQQPFLNNGCIILKENEQLASALSTLHYGYYTDLASLKQTLLEQLPALQCIVGVPESMGYVSITPFGGTQSPALDDFADGINTFKFLASIGS